MTIQLQFFLSISKLSVLLSANVKKCKNSSPWSDVETKECPTEPDPKPFKRRFEDVPTRESYQGELENSFWINWPWKNILEVIETWIDYNALSEEANRAGYTGTKINKTLDWLRNGVDLGCVGDARLQTISRNNQS